eukprot:GCRY01003468.1.p1 GENE.GCRY01003468.1~~GCRY01003468.1.p1  ORF type:complete len:289 (-),score=35.55 GCRY01003468.1:103-969(-)
MMNDTYNKEDGEEWFGGSPEFATGNHNDMNDSQQNVGGSTTSPNASSSAPPFSSLAPDKTNLFMNYVLPTANAQAMKFYDNYSRFDALRPYFDNIEASTILQRIALSLKPWALSTQIDTFSSAPSTAEVDLYGPFMVIFTLISILVFGMKLSGVEVAEGTLLGASFFLVFFYWIGGTLVFYFIAFLMNSSLTFIYVLYSLGYAHVGFVIPLFSYLFFPPFISTPLLVVAGGLSAITLARRLKQFIVDRSQSLIFGLIVGGLHFVFLLYLRMAYYSFVSAVEEKIDTIS